MKVYKSIIPNLELKCRLQPSKFFILSIPVYDFTVFVFDECLSLLKYFLPYLVSRRFSNIPVHLLTCMSDLRVEIDGRSLLNPSRKLVTQVNTRSQIEAGLRINCIPCSNKKRRY